MSKIRNLIRFITRKSNNYDEKYMKIKLTLDYALPLNETLVISTITIVVSAVFHENNKYPLVFLDDCLYKRQK